MPRRSSRSRPASFTSWSEPTGSAARTAIQRSPGWAWTRALYPLGRIRLPCHDVPLKSVLVARPKRTWIQEERRKTLGDFVAFCARCGFTQRYFLETEDDLARSC